MATLVEWFPADGSASARFTTGAAAPLRLLRLEGTEPVTVEPVTVKSPEPAGRDRARRRRAAPGRHARRAPRRPPRPAAAWDLRAALLRSLVQQPTRLGETYALGRLRVTLDGRAAARAPGAAAQRARRAPVGHQGDRPVRPRVARARAVLARDVADTQVLFTGTGGFGFAVEFPLEMTSNNVEVEIANLGDVDAPITARLYGDVTTARIRNLTTGEVLEITGNIAATEYVEVSTAFGDKRVEQVVDRDRRADLGHGPDQPRQARLLGAPPGAQRRDLRGRRQRAAGGPSCTGASARAGSEPMTRAYVLDPVTRATLGLVDQSWERLSYTRRYVAMDTFELVINRTRLWASELAEEPPAVPARRGRPRVPHRADREHRRGQHAQRRDDRHRALARGDRDGRAPRRAAGGREPRPA